ncbi:hypothetical protein JKP88DRAFT_266681, partial [Tribonema minus]
MPLHRSRRACVTAPEVTLRYGVWAAAHPVGRWRREPRAPRYPSLCRAVGVCVENFRKFLADNPHDVDEKISEAFVALGRLNHCKKKRQLQISGLKANLDERVGYAYVDARREIEQQRAILHAQLDKLYRKSVNELELHRQAVEEPAQSSLRVLEAHIASAERAGDALKALLGRPEQAEMLPQLQRAVGDVLAVLSASTSLDD